MRAITKTAAVLAGALMLAGCAAPAATSDPGTTSGDTQVEEPIEIVETVDLEGDWTEVGGDANNYQEATITGDEIEIYWVAEEEETRALYWAGDVIVPEGEQSFTWESTNDTSKTDSALLASTSENKEFEYADGQITYEVSAMGVTKTVTLGR
jgi:hypothetical protein